MADQDVEIRDAIARRLYRHRMGFDNDRWTPDDEALAQADAVLSLFEQVGWHSTVCSQAYGVRTYSSLACLRFVDEDPGPGFVPVFALRSMKGTPHA